MSRNLPARIRASQEVTDYLRGKQPTRSHQWPQHALEIGPLDDVKSIRGQLVKLLSIASVIIIVLSIAAGLGFGLLLGGDPNEDLLASNSQLVDTVNTLVDELKSEREEDAAKASKINPLYVVGFILFLAAACISYGLAGRFGLAALAIAAIAAGAAHIGAI